jgi:hypothetical protein
MANYDFGPENKHLWVGLLPKVLCPKLSRHEASDRPALISTKSCDRHIVVGYSISKWRRD